MSREIIRALPAILGLAKSIYKTIQKPAFLLEFTQKRHRF